MLVMCLGDAGSSSHENTWKGSSYRTTDASREGSMRDQNSIEVGPWIDKPSIGEWSSNAESQFGYLLSKKGMIYLKTEKDKDDSKNLIFAFYVFENEYTDDKYISFSGRLQLKDPNQYQFNGDFKDSPKKGRYFFFLNREKSCTMSASIELTDRSGKPVGVDTADLEHLVISGTIGSDECALCIRFRSETNFFSYKMLLIFFCLMMFSMAVSVRTFIKMILSRDIRRAMNISFAALFSSLVVDVTSMASFHILTDTFLRFHWVSALICFMLLLIQPIVKCRISFYVGFVRAGGVMLDANQLLRHQLLFILKFSVAMTLTSYLAIFLIPFYQLYLLIFLYPVFQIVYNCIENDTKNCFSWDLQFCMIFPQLFYPVAIRSFSANIFTLYKDYVFCSILTGLIIVQLFILYLQRAKGPCFFLPHCLKPNVHPYKQPINNLNGSDRTDCPICFIPLVQQPDKFSDQIAPLATKYYAETPCKHQFHESCLKLWMAIKLQCPSCLSKIPPINN
jgi:hypothetical protein